MRLASHILAVFVAISTVVSPCLAAIKSSNDNAARLQKIILASVQSDATLQAAQFAEEVKAVCNGPCARLLNARNIQPFRNAIVNEFDGIVPVALLIQPREPDNVLPTKRLTSLTNWNSVDIYHLCRQLN
ncbi:hypothetical protein MNBD_ALPHA08-2413 [hydrothermal vent metagenome]|uniref:Uncharacterized protein n=1 Tax=hydrothermal vent metagenome TaxID=652676 RepID=A0A3B0R767_9ZZZZ